MLLIHSPSNFGMCCQISVASQQVGDLGKNSKTHKDAHVSLVLLVLGMLFATVFGTLNDYNNKKYVCIHSFIQSFILSFIAEGWNEESISEGLRCVLAFRSRYVVVAYPLVAEIAPVLFRSSLATACDPLFVV